MIRIISSISFLIIILSSCSFKSQDEIRRDMQDYALEYATLAVVSLADSISNHNTCVDCFNKFDDVEAEMFVTDKIVEARIDAYNDFNKSYNALKDKTKNDTLLHSAISILDTNLFHKNLDTVELAELTIAVLFGVIEETIAPNGKVNGSNYKAEVKYIARTKAKQRLKKALGKDFIVLESEGGRYDRLRGFEDVFFFPATDFYVRLKNPNWNESRLKKFLHKIID